MKNKDLKTDSLPENQSEPILDNKGNVIRESSIIELMHQRDITREEAIEIYRDPK